MAILPVLEHPDKRLRQVSAPVDCVDDALRALMDDMRDTMYDARGIGLAAIQVGEPRRVLVIDLQEEDGPPENKGVHYFINPEILWSSEDQKAYCEGCLSVPDIFADVDRPETIRARWQDYDGVQHEKEITGLLAVCLQHEMDHLNGILFVDHLSRLKRDMLFKKRTKSRRTTHAA